MEEYIKIIVAVLAAIIYFLFNSRQKDSAKPRPGEFIPPVRPKAKELPKVEKSTFGDVLKEYEADMKRRTQLSGKLPERIRDKEDLSRKESVSDMKRTSDAIKRDLLRKQPSPKLVKHDFKKQETRMLSQKDDGKLIDRKEDEKLIRRKDERLIDRKNDGKLMHPDEDAELFLTNREKGMRGKIQNSELSEDYKIHKKEDHPIVKLLREKDTMRHAVILSEILRRKW